MVDVCEIGQENLQRKGNSGEGVERGHWRLVMRPFAWRCILAPTTSIVGLGLARLGYCEPRKTATTNLADCENPTCHDTLELFTLARKRRIATTKTTKKSNNPYTEGCPATRGDLGDSTWKLIHTIAANYPDNPSEEDKKYTHMFFESLSVIYPCPHCAKDFRESFLERPVE